MDVQVLLTKGDEKLVVLSRRDCDALLARAGDDEAEDRMADRIVKRSREERRARGGHTMPGWLSAAILAGQHPLRAARAQAKLTQAELADRSSLSRSYVSQLESGKALFDEPSLAAVAGALNVDPDWLRD